MPNVDHFVIKFTNTNVDAQNFQLVDFDCDLIASGMSVDEAAARLVYYFNRLSDANCIADDTAMVGIDYRAPGSAGATPVPFPTATPMAAIAAVVTASPYNWNGLIASSYTLLQGGGGGLCPLGTSISVSEFTATVGPTGRGRHFLPFTGTDAVNPGGTLGTGQIADIKQAYDVLFLGEDETGAPGGPLDELHPCVTNATRTTEHPITLVRAQPIFSNLESRRR